MRYSADFIEQVREANNLVEIIGQHTELKGRGHQFMGLCPFPDHHEKSPSFSVSEPKQLYHCFGCKKSGNLFTFLETYSGLSFTDAVEFLARRAGIPLPKSDYEVNQKINKPGLYRVNKYAAAFFHRQLKALPENNPILLYLTGRGISTETIDEMKIGYASEEWSGLYEFFREKQVPIKDAEQLGLIKAKKQNGFFDIFRHRIIFPIFSVQDDVLGFGGRVVDKEQKPKYLNSPESPVFSKGRTFYGLNFSGKHIRTKDRAVIVEGYMDYIALYSRGINNVVATLGTALTEEHAKLIKKYTNNVVLMFDGDFAGQQAAERSLTTLFSQGLCPLAVSLPDGLDPDDYIRQHGPEALQKQVDQAQELFILLINDWLKDFKFSSHEKLQFMDKVRPLLSAIGDTALLDLYVKEVAKRLTVEEKWILKQLKETKTSVKPRSVEEVSMKNEVIEPALEQITLKGAPREELYVLGFAVNSSELLDKVIESQVLDKMTSQHVKILLSVVIDRYRQNPNDFDKLAPLIVSRVKDPAELTGLFKFWSLIGADEEALKATLNCINRVEDRAGKRQSEIIAGQLQNGENATYHEKLEQIMNINKKRIQSKRQIKGEP